MMDEIWGFEEGWWTLGAAEARRRMHPLCVMVFPEGIMQAEDILAGMEAGPRWKNVVLSDRVAVETGDIVVLAYRGRAERADGTLRDVLCSSTWMRGAEGWRIVQHQQTAASEAGGKAGAGETGAGEKGAA